MLLRVLKLTRQIVDLLLLIVKLLFKLNNLLGQLWHLRDLLPNDNKLPLSLLELKVDHPDLFFLLSNLLLSIFQNVLLDVALFIQDAKLIIFVD